MVFRKSSAPNVQPKRLHIKRVLAIIVDARMISHSLLDNQKNWNLGFPSLFSNLLSLIRLRDNSKLIPEFGQFAAAVVKLLDGRELKDIVTLIEHSVPKSPLLSENSSWKNKIAKFSIWLFWAQIVKDFEFLADL